MPNYTIEAVIGEGDLPIKIEFDYEPGTPGKHTGPMEDSYPAEGPSLEVCGVLACGRWDITGVLGHSWSENVEEICIEHIASIGEA